MQYYNSADYPYFEEHFLSDADCNLIINYTERNLHLFDENSSQGANFWSKRVINYHRVSDAAVRAILIGNNKNVADKIRNRLPQDKPVYADTLQIVRWFKGYELTPHADKENPDGRPHPFPWRDFGSVVYLNDDYIGGEIHFPNKNFQIKPKKGMLAIFPGTVEFLHGVREVTDGVRYTLPSFFTFDQSKTIRI